MPTKVLVFESDATFAEELRQGLSRLDCNVTIVDDAGAGLQTATRERPDLILLAIELPRMNGFSVCNKLKRDPGLKDVPLIIMSSESSDETFDQHRRLRTRAEDYVHKPVSFAELLARTHPFIELGSTGASPPSNGSTVAEDDLQIEEESVEILETHSAEVADAEVALETDQLTDQAFDSILDPSQAPAPPVQGSPIAASGPEQPVSSRNGAGNPNEADALEFAEAEVHAEQHEADVESAILSSVFPSEPRLSSLVPPPSARPSSPMPNGRSVAPHAQSEMPGHLLDTDTQRLSEELERYRERANELEEAARVSAARIIELEDAQRRSSARDHEIQRLQRELDEAKSRASASRSPGAGSAREFLDLREQLNKKDKELLDLRDQLTHRDKELVILRDGVIDLERQRADLQDHIADAEKQLAKLQQSNQALSADKEVASKRAEDFKLRSEKLKAALDEKTTESAELKALLDAERAARIVSERELETRAQAALEAAVLATETTERERAEQALAAARAEAEQTLADTLERERSAAASATNQLLAAREAELNEAHGQRLNALERDSEEAQRRLRAESEQALLNAENSGRQQLSDLRAELESARSREVEALRREQEGVLGERDATHAAVLAERDATHAAVLAERNDTVARLEHELSTRTGERDEARRDLEKRKLRVEGLETDLAQTRSNLEATEGTLSARESSLAELSAAFAEKSSEATSLASRLAAAETRLSELEASLASVTEKYEQTRVALENDQAVLSRARSKWEGDRTSLERMKDALAAALAQVDQIEARTFE